MQLSDVNQALDHVGRVTQANAAAAEESSAEAESLGSQADALGAAVAELNKLVGDRPAAGGRHRNGGTSAWVGDELQAGA